MIRPILIFFLLFCIKLNADKTVSEIFNSDYRNQLFMDVEVSLAQAQASLGIIPKWAADAIESKADTKYMSQKDINAELEILIYEQKKNANFIELSVAKVMDYFNINSPYGGRLKKNHTLMSIDGLLSIWNHPSL